MTSIDLLKRQGFSIPITPPEGAVPLVLNEHLLQVCQSYCKDAVQSKTIYKIYHQTMSKSSLAPPSSEQPKR